MDPNRRMVFFIEWDKDFINFIKGITLSSSLRGNIVVHIFYRHDISTKSLPKYQPWLFKHPASTEQPDSAWRLLESYVTRFKFEADYSLTPVEKRRPKSAASLSSSRDGFCVNNSNPSRAYYVISKSTRSCEELVQTLHKRRRVKLEFVDFKPETTLLDFVQFQCPHCQIAFTAKVELVNHDRDTHGFVCPNPECKFNKKENSFQRETDLKQHIKNQLRCVFCPTKVFCSSDVLEIHKKNSHKKCACPCGNYFGERLSYLDHFFAVYPSPASISSSLVSSARLNCKIESAANRGNLPVGNSRKIGVAEKQKISVADNSVTAQTPGSCNLGGCTENIGHD